jgi:hypothetical protein
MAGERSTNDIHLRGLSPAQGLSILVQSYIMNFILDSMYCIVVEKAQPIL